LTTVISFRLPADCVTSYRPIFSRPY